MKKILSAVMAGLLVCGAVSAQSIKVANYFGGDADATGGSDLFIFENQKDAEGNYTNEFNNTTRVSDKIQLDASSKIFDSRVRMELAGVSLDGKNTTLRLRGYGRFKPVNQFQLIAGNEFFTKVVVDAGYLAASGDYPKYARMLQNGFGAESGWTFGEDNNIKVLAAGGIKGTDNSLKNAKTMGLDFGLNIGVTDIMSAGATLQNVTTEKMTAAVFAGLNAVKGLTLNAGYIYYATDYLPAAAKNAVSLTAGYNFSDLGLTLAADVISGLGDENDAGVPLYTKVAVTYKANDSITVAAKAKLTAMLGKDSMNTQIYPSVTYQMPSSMGSLTTGVRLDMNKAGIAKIAVPFNWTVTLADIKK